MFFSFLAAHPAFCLILAQADAAGALPDPKSYQAMGWMVAAVAGIAVTANQIIGAWQKIFPPQQPPNHEVYATKAELAKLEEDHEEEMVRIEKRFETWLEQNDQHHREEIRVLTTWKEDMAGWQRDLSSAFGKLQAMFELAVKNKGK